MNQGIQIAIDGPVAAGKSTVARRLAERTGFIYVDTGAMYRAITLLALRHHLSFTDEAGLTQLVNQTQIDVRKPTEGEMDGRLSTVTIDGEDISWAIRTPEIAQHVATVAALKGVREALVKKQQQIAVNKNVVMEGRDITYVVLPDADLKIFLTGREEIRSERYYQKMINEGKQITKDQATKSLQDRDLLDKNREVSPLKILPGVWVLDTTTMTIDQVVDEIQNRITHISRKV